MSMRTGILAIGTLSLGLLAGMPAVSAEGVGAGKTTAGPVLSEAQAIEQGDYQAVYAALVKALENRAISPADKESLRMATLLEVIRVTGANVMTEYAKNPSKRKFLVEFAKDTRWQELYLGCGLVPYQTDIGIDVLYRIWRAEPGIVKNKPLAVALASVWGGGETAPNPAIQKKNPNRFNPVWRYQFFQSQAEKGLLHPNYKNLQPWELRFVVGIPGQDWDDASYAYAAKHINLPWDQYGQACWSAIYTGTSRFGDSVQSGMYNLPYSAESDAETTHQNGGVCGAMSHLGAVAAMAHGIPAYTVGQPGHCAYGVRTERGKWVGGFGGPDGGAHNYIFIPRYPTGYLLMESVYADDAKIRDAYKMSVCARALEAVGKTPEAVESWKAALALSPLHPFFRKELHRLMLATDLTPDTCYAYMQEMIPLYKGNGFAVVEVAKDLDKVMVNMTDEQKLAIYGQMHAMIADTQSSWATTCGELLDTQLATLPSDEAAEKYLAMALTAHVNAGDGTTFGQVLEWAVKTFVQKDKAEAFGKAFALAAESAPAAQGPADKDKAKKMRDAYSKAIVAAEQARSAPAFKALVDAAIKASGPVQPAGKLELATTPAGAPAPAVLFRGSTSCQWDTASAHAAVMTLEGGKCHTDKEKTPSFIVELAQKSELTGCIIRKSNGNADRMKKATVYTSADGATWMKKESVDNMPTEWCVTFPAGTEGKWVKVEFDNGDAPNFAHLSHFVVYSK
ncbi:MAG: hypothetical protein IKV82_07865 [Akkermansia sp.]|nr:hypothetical protein [Akkermansia sp.]